VNAGVDDRAALVALLRRIGLCAPGAADRIEADGPRAVLAEELGVGSNLLAEDPEPLIADARDEIAGWDAAGLRLITVLDGRYPANLRLVHDRPALVFLAGDADLAAQRSSIAVVGSRHPSEDGHARATGLATELSRAGLNVVSGLAAGIDTAAHRAALAAGGRTVAVIGTGHEHDYPPENARLQAELARSQAVVSSLWPDTGPHPDNFRRRNGLMSGLSRGTIIVEASARSGTRVQARLALGHGRPVFLLAPLVAQPWAQELARRPGVHVVETAAEVIAISRRLDDPGPLADEAG
jgi:DNA processing protein